MRSWIVFMAAIVAIGSPTCLASVDAGECQTGKGTSVPHMSVSVE